MTSEAQIEAMQDADAAFFEALLNRDIPALETLLAEEFLIVDVASGSVHTREAFLSAIRDGVVSFREIKTPVISAKRLDGYWEQRFIR